MNPGTIVTMDAPGGAPVAVGDSYFVPAGDGLVVLDPGVLRNDSDPQGDPLFAVLVSGPAHGSFGLGAFGDFSYTPETGFAGLDSFVYQAFDGTRYSDAVTVEITVERIEIAGNTRSEKLVGTEHAEIFRPHGGGRDHIFLGGGMDIVAFGPETRDGSADITRIFGFGPDDDLDLGGASVVALREQKNGWLRLTLDGDGDIILLEGLTRSDVDGLI